MTVDDAPIGRRAREIRVWRRMTQETVAHLAGISPALLSQIETGVSPVVKRRTLDGLAAALRVAPTDLLENAVPSVPAVHMETRVHVEAINMALAHNRLHDPWRAPLRPWEPIRRDVATFLDTLVPACDYVTQASLVPDLLEDLYAAYVAHPEQRLEVLVALARVLTHTAALLKNVGFPGSTQFAASHVLYVADELAERDGACWRAGAAWRLAQSCGNDRQRMLRLSLQAADDIDGDPDPRAGQAYGMLHLNAAWASATLGRADDAREHMEEAQRVIGHADTEHLDFLDMHFGVSNWGVWRVAVGVELGEGPAVAAYEPHVDVAALPTAERRGMFYADMARGLAQDRSRRKQAVEMVLRADREAPQRIRTNPFMRETVASLMSVGGVELRRVAYAMGMAL